MNFIARTLILLFFSQLVILADNLLHAQLVHKFESISSDQGLSQNFVQSVFCDDKGFLWFGTWDGLNRYDGRQFKTFKVNPNQKNSLTNNRIINIWQDQQNTLWVKTNDGYIHYFIEETYEFITYPYYLKSLEERNSTITCFVESKKQEVLLGSSNSGMYYLTYDEASDQYQERQFLNRGESTISDNSITFILTDEQNDVWIGTKRGLNNISQVELSKESPSFANYWLEYHFTAGYQLDSMLLFGTEGNGIKTYESNIKRFDTYPDLFRELADKSITIIETPSAGRLLVGTEHHGLYIYDLNNRQLHVNLLQGKTIRKVYKDSFGKIWVNTLEFGIYQLDTNLKSLQHYNLTGKDVISTVDDERQFIYEDSKQNLWIALHGGGLAHYNRPSDNFEFYRNQSNDKTTISSDNVYCISEDQSGMLWVGTGIPNGGVNKVYTSNEAFRQILLNEQIETSTENVVRAVLIDENKNIWLGTKSGDLYILDPTFKIKRKISQMPLVDGYSPGHNAYTMMQDEDGFIWIGTKGGGIFVTATSVHEPNFSYTDIQFHHYQVEPGDTSSLNSNLIYSILQDSNGNIWIGTFEAGLHLVTNREDSSLTCRNYNTSNSSISSDKVRNLFEDHLHRLWITTDFGVNYIDLDHHNVDESVIYPSLFDPRKANSLSYNDVIHVYQDSRNDLWFGTSGGGINRLLKSNADSLQFAHLNSQDGLINDVVYSIQEDDQGQIWFSTVHGISRYNPADSTFENFDQSNNLATDVFNENTCAVTSDGALLFGTNNGLLVVYPNKIQNEQFMPNVVFTNFQLFNKDVDIRDPDSPIKQDIETLDQIVLKYFQSSFSIDYTALSYYSPTKNKYAFMLENFDEDWNEVGNQNKATYTNLSPGEYIFKVKAASWNSDWSDKTRNILIKIQPPWWKTTIMYIVYFIVLIIIFEIIRRSYVRYHKLQNDLNVEKRVSDIKLQFFTNISHEIRTPLTLILGPIHDMLDIEKIPGNISSKLHLVEKNAKRMLRLVNQLLDFRKVQKKKMQLHVHKIELFSFLSEIIENFDLVAAQKHIKIAFEDSNDQLQVWVDPNKFDSVIFNILSNALKFSPKEAQVHVKIKNVSAEFVDIIISDKGAGIPRNQLNQIFQRFSPLSKEDEEFGSSGIGLAYSYEIVKLHHGDILVKSEPGKGSVFTVRLLKDRLHFSQEEIELDQFEPLYKIKHEKVIENEVDLDVEQPELIKVQDYHILIVEDNHEILNYLKDSLAKICIVTTCDNGREALDRIKEVHPDLVITDIMMPEVDGIELTKKLKDSFDTSHIPVVMLTAKSSMEDQIEGIESGAEAYILKPFNMVYVRAVVNNLIRQRCIIHSKYIHEREVAGAEIKITSKDEKFLDDISVLIMNNYSDPDFNIEKLVENSYVSRTVFYHKIKSLTGLTPIDFLRQKRLSIAAQMIIQSDYNISEVAYNTGFNDNKYFSKKFKGVYGMTPSEYKNKHRQEIIN